MATRGDVLAAPRDSTGYDPVDDENSSVAPSGCSNSSREIHAAYG